MGALISGDCSRNSKADGRYTAGTQLIIMLRVVIILWDIGGHVTARLELDK